MKISCPKEDFLTAISRVQGAVSPKTTLPILSNVLMEANKGKLTLTTTDLDVGIQYSIKVSVLEPGASTLPARRLFSIIKELPDGDINISITENHIASITCGNAHFKIVGLSREEFPKLPEFPKGKEILLSQVLLRDMISKTSYAISHDESRYVLNGLYLMLKSGKAMMVATDGRRLAFIEKKTELAKGTVLETIIPAKTISELLKLLEDEGTVEIVLAKNQIAFRFQNGLLISRLIEGRYPDYKQVIPESLEHKISLNRGELLSAVRRSILVTSDRSNSVKLNFSANKLVVSANTPDVGESRESLKVPFKGKEVEIAFNPAFIIDALKNIEADEVFFEVTNGFNPGVFKTSSEFLYVIMPMRLS